MDLESASKIIDDYSFLLHLADLKGQKKVKEAITQIMKKSGCDEATAIDFFNWATDGLMENDLSDEELGEKPENNKTIVVKCPYCHSKNTQKISEWEKNFDRIWLEIQAKEWHCNNCNSDF